MSADVWVGVLAVGGGFALALGVFLLLLRRAGSPSGKLRLTVELAVFALAAAACGAIATIDGLELLQASRADGGFDFSALARLLTPLVGGVLLTRITIRTFGRARRAWAAGGSE